jgi:hypothetical protein
VGKPAKLSRASARSVVALVVAVIAALAPAGAARAADFTWSGAASTPNWSVSGNWVGGTAPSGTVGDLDFPALSSPGCLASPVASACYVSTNDSSVTATSISVDDGAGYTIAGNLISLGAGGITAAPSESDEASVDSRVPTLTLSAPLNLRAQQEWSITGDIDTPEVLVAGAVSGPPGDPLAISLSQPVILAFENANVGLVSVTGDGNPQNGAIQIGSLDTAGTVTPGSLNATDGEAVTFGSGAGLFALAGTIGPVSMVSGIVQVGESDHAGTLAVAGDVAIDAQSELFSYINGPGTVPGESYSQLTATGDVNLAGATLELGDGADSGGVCGLLNPGDVDTLVTTTGALVGEFANAPDGTTISPQCFATGGTAPTVRIDYPGNTVTATVISAGTAPATSATMLSVDPANPVTNQPVTLTATVTPGTGAPNGLVEFFNDSGSIAGCEGVPVTGSGDSYTATCQTAFSAATPPSLSATFEPGAASTLAGSQSPTVAPVVALAPTTTTVTISPAIVGLNQATVYTATVTSSQAGAAVPGGSVVFFVNGQPLAQGATGSPSCTGVPLTAGATSAAAACREIFTDGTGTQSFATTATYSGDANFAASTSPPETVTVNGSRSPAPPGSGSGKIGSVVLGRANATATMADVVVTCKGSRGQRCTVTLKLASREKTRAGKVVAATAAKAKTRTRTRTVTVGTRTITLDAGLGETVHVKLNAPARRVLARLHRLPVTLTATQRTSRGASRPSLRHFTFKVPAARA